SCTSVTTTSFEALRKAKTEIGSGHNSFVYVPESPLAREDASTLPLGRVKLRYGPTSQCHTRRRTGVSGRVGDGWWFKPRFGGCRIARHRRRCRRDRYCRLDPNPCGIERRGWV